VTVAELLSRLSAREFAEWRAYYALELLGDERSDLQAGIIASTVANARGGRRRPLVPRDFMPYAKRQPQATEASKDLSRRIRAALIARNR
jgi:hypothetical protein